MLQLHEVVKSYDGKSTVTALAAITLSIAPGEMVAIMGPSGSGKSTLLNLMGGLDVPTSGRVLVGGKDLARESEKDRSLFRRTQVSYIFQAYHLMPTLRVRQNVALPLHLAGVPAGEAAGKVERVLFEVGLEHRGDHLPDELSGGERQRVAIARALVNNPPLLLADEPTGNLDSRSGAEILKILIDLNKQGVTIMIVTHDKDIAAQCRRTINIKDGLIVGDQVSS